MSLDDRVTEACHRIEEMYHETDGKCYISFSGGKDSTVLLALEKLCEEIYSIPEQIPAVFANTGIEMGVTLDFVKWVKGNYYRNLTVVYPEKPFGWVLENKGKPIRSKVKSEFIGRYHRGTRTVCTMRNLIEGVTNSGKTARRVRLADKDMHMVHDDFDIKASPECCKYMKKTPFAKYARAMNIKGYAVGIRADEGGARAMNIKSQEMFVEGKKICTSYAGGYIKKAPIVDWSEEDINEFVEKYNVPLSKAYTEFGFDRTGCMGCPFSKTIDFNLKYLYEHEPNRYKACMHWLKDVYIAQNVILPFDESYERERERKWAEQYEGMRQEMLRKYRPESALIREGQQLSIFNFLGEENERTEK